MGGGEGGRGEEGEEGGEEGWGEAVAPEDEVAEEDG